MSRPVKELKGFEKISLEAGASAQINFQLTADELAFYNSGLEKQAEAGEFVLMIGPDSDDLQEVTFELLESSGQSE